MSERRELTMLVHVDRLPAAGQPFRLRAGEAERTALAKRFDLVGLDRLEAEGRVDPLSEVNGVRVSGRLRAEVVQSCVVTFEPVPATIDAPFEVVFARQPDEDADDEIDVDPNIDDPEPLESDELDVGEIVAQELSLALDPYPRSPSADRAMSDVEAKEDAAGPFAALGRLRVH
ncbi:MAG: DUF177 domain-containing protein [Geminicoccaceae bacterium]